jgi:hypothetical protein
LWLSPRDGDSGGRRMIPSIQELTDRLALALDGFRVATADRWAVISRTFSPSLVQVAERVDTVDLSEPQFGHPGTVVLTPRRRESPSNLVPHWEAALPAAVRARPAEGSMGMVDAVLGEARVQAEIASALAGHRTLSIIRVITDLDPALTRRDRSRAERAVARAIESTIGEHDVAYANGPDDFVVILPEADATAAALVVTEIAAGANRATILTGRDRRRHRFAELGSVRLSPSTIAGRLAA